MKTPGRNKGPGTAKKTRPAVLAAAETTLQPVGELDFGTTLVSNLDIGVEEYSRYTSDIRKRKTYDQPNRSSPNMTTLLAVPRFWKQETRWMHHLPFLPPLSMLLQNLRVLGKTLNGHYPLYRTQLRSYLSCPLRNLSSFNRLESRLCLGPSLVHLSLRPQSSHPASMWRRRTVMVFNHSNQMCQHSHLHLHKSPRRMWYRQRFRYLSKRPQYLSTILSHRLQYQQELTSHRSSFLLPFASTRGPHSPNLLHTAKVLEVLRVLNQQLLPLSLVVLGLSVLGVAGSGAIRTSLTGALRGSQQKTRWLTPVL